MGPRLGRFWRGRLGYGERVPVRGRLEPVPGKPEGREDQRGGGTSHGLGIRGPDVEAGGGKAGGAGNRAVGLQEDG
jgi:hypothetical protein